MEFAAAGRLETSQHSYDDQNEVQLRIRVKYGTYGTAMDVSLMEQHTIR